MAAREKQPGNAPSEEIVGADSNLARHQAFRVKRVNRQQIQLAAYNPRVQSPESDAMLERSLGSLGLVETLVWNERTGNLVGGHKRIGRLDHLEGRDDYDLDVAVVDVDEATEKKLNLALNNRNLQGDWDEEGLADILREFGEADYKDIGVTEADLDYLIGETSGLREFAEDTPERRTMKGTLADIKQDRAQMNRRLADEQNVDFYCVVVFEDYQQRDDFYAALGLNPADIYLRGADLARLLVPQGGD